MTATPTLDDRDVALLAMTGVAISFATRRDFDAAVASCAQALADAREDCARYIDTAGRAMAPAELVEAIRRGDHRYEYEDTWHDCAVCDGHDRRCRLRRTAVRGAA